MMSKFAQAVKSTLDKVLVAKAQALGVDYVDIDDLSAIRKITDTNNTAVLCHFQDLEGKPHNLHDGVASVGCRLATDPGNYSLIGMLEEVSSLFPIGVQIPVKNYSAAGVSGLLGTIIIRSNKLLSTEAMGSGNARFREITFTAYEFI